MVLANYRQVPLLMLPTATLHHILIKKMRRLRGNEKGDHHLLHWTHYEYQWLFVCVGTRKSIGEASLVVRADLVLLVDTGESVYAVSEVATLVFY